MIKRAELYWNFVVKMIIDYLFKAVIIGHVESNDMMIMVEMSDVIYNSEKKLAYIF